MSSWFLQHYRENLHRMWSGWVCCAAWLTFIVRSYEIAVMAWMCIRIHNKITFWFSISVNSIYISFGMEQWRDRRTDTICKCHSFIRSFIHFIQSVNYIEKGYVFTSRVNCVMLFHIHNCYCLLVVALLIDVNVSIHLTVEEKKHKCYFMMYVWRNLLEVFLNKQEEQCVYSLR